MRNAYVAVKMRMKYEGRCYVDKSCWNNEKDVGDL